MLSIRLPEDVEKKLDKLSFMSGRSKSFYIRFAICAMLDQIEVLKKEEKNYFNEIKEHIKTEIFMYDYF